MPALVSAGLEAVIREWYVWNRAFELSTLEFRHLFSFSLFLLLVLSSDGI